jgi:hypothetical protein
MHCQHCALLNKPPHDLEALTCYYPGHVPHVTLQLLAPQGPIPGGLLPC